MNNLFPNNTELSNLLQDLSYVEKDSWKKAIKALDNTADLDLLKKDILPKELDAGRLVSCNDFYWLDDQIGDHKQTLLKKEAESLESNRISLEDCFDIASASASIDPEL